MSNESAPKSKCELSAGEELRLRVYDKLWENIIHKENRLWTFLTVYGAAAGFIISQGLGESNEFRYPAYLALLVLTYWAGEIIIDSDWWSIRNRLMIRGIEQGHEQELRGVIPARYNSVGLRGESLHSASTAVICVVGFLTYGIAMKVVFQAEDPVTTAAWAVALYLFGGIAIVRWLHMRERRLQDYYSTLRDLNKQTQRVEVEIIREQEVKDYRRVTWRTNVLFLYGIVVGVMALLAWDRIGTVASFLFFAVQVLLLILFLVQRDAYMLVLPGCVGFGLGIPDTGELRILAYVYRSRAMFVLFILSGLILYASIAGLM